MHVGDVREVAEVVVDEHVIGLVVDAPRAQRPGRIIEPDRRRDQRRVRRGRIAHPTQIQLCMSTAAYRRTRAASGNRFLPGNLDAAAGRLELEAVIHAADVVAFAPAEGQRRLPMAAPVFEHDDFAATGAIEQQRLVDDRERRSCPVGHSVLQAATYQQFFTNIGVTPYVHTVRQYFTRFLRGRPLPLHLDRWALMIAGSRPGKPRVDLVAAGGVVHLDAPALAADQARLAQRLEVLG